LYLGGGGTLARDCSKKSGVFPGNGNHPAGPGGNLGPRSGAVHYRVLAKIFITK